MPNKFVLSSCCLSLSLSLSLFCFWIHGLRTRSPIAARRNKLTQPEWSASRPSEKHSLSTLHPRVLRLWLRLRLRPSLCQRHRLCLRLSRLQRRVLRLRHRPRLWWLGATSLDAAGFCWYFQCTRVRSRSRHVDQLRSS